MRRPKAGSVVLLLATAALTLWPLAVLADPPGWVVHPPSFEYDGSIIASVDLGEGAFPDSADILGAFVDTQCRGVTTAWETPGGDYIFLMSVYSDTTSGEYLWFQYYDESADAVLGVLETIPFEPNMIVGSLLHPEQFTPANKESWTAIKALFR